MITHGNDALRIDEAESPGEAPKWLPDFWAEADFNEMAARIRIDANQTGAAHYHTFRDGRRWLCWRLPRRANPVLP